MLSGLARTFSLLKETANEAAVPVLVAALDSSDLAIHQVNISPIASDSPSNTHDQLRMRSRLRWM